MAALDAQLQFSAAQALPNNTTAQSTNVVDLAVAGKMFGTTQPMIFYMLWSGTPAGTTLRIDLRSNDTTDLTSTPRIHWSTGIITAADGGGTAYASAGIGAGLAPTCIYMPNGTFNPGIQSTGGTYLQYLGLIFVSTGDNSVGVLTAGLAQALDMRTYHAIGYTPPSI